MVLVVDPHSKKPLRIESPTGENWGLVAILDKIANLNRKRSRPENIQNTISRQTNNMVEVAYKEHINKFTVKGG